MSADDRDYELLNGADSVEIFLKIDEIISDSDVRNIKAKSRKCLFSNEPQKYFDVSNWHLRIIERTSRDWYFHRFTAKIFVS